MRRLVIVNPAASRAPAGREVVRRLAAEGAGSVRETEGPGHATRMAREAATEGTDRILVAGGDGTLNEVVNGLLGPGKSGPGGGPAAGGGKTDGPVVEILPLGTGNDFARTLGLPMDPEEAAERLTGMSREGRVRRVDLGLFRGEEDRYFVNVVVGGVGGVVEARVTRARKRRWGALAYRIQAVRAVPQLPEHTVAARLDHRELPERRSFGVVVANGRFAGGGIPVAPGARPDDGLLDVLVLPAPGLLGTGRLLLRALRGRHVDDPEVAVHRARTVRLESAPVMEYDVDGELMGRETVTLEVVPGALRVLASPSADW